MSLDPRVEAIRDKYGLQKDDFWKLPQGRDVWLVKHAALEVVAAKAGITFDMPEIIEANGGDGVAAICVRGFLGDRSIWSIGEANPKNCKNAYPWAIAEKRAIDRVVLKLVGLHGLVYSEEESDDFKNRPSAPPVEDETYAPPPLKANGLPEVGWKKDGSRTSFWLKTNGTAAELKAELLHDATDCHTLKQLDELKAFYRGKARELKFNKAYNAVLLEEFNRIEASIMEAMEAEELADVPLGKALKQSLNILAGG